MAVGDRAVAAASRAWSDRFRFAARLRCAMLTELVPPPHLPAHDRLLPASQLGDFLMQFDDAPEAAVGAGLDDRPWWKGLTRYQWFVFIVASLGWLFDTMDQQLFNLARISAVRDLLGVQAGDRKLAAPVDSYGGYATTIFMIGWALGGFFFGVLGDSIGRAKTMLLTVLCYSAFTGLSALSVGFWDFAVTAF